MKDVSVVIPICCPDRELITIVDRLIRQTYNIKEIILINTKRCFDGSLLVLDEIEERLKAINKESILKIHEITAEEFDHGGTRDMGLKMASSRYVMFMTQDAVPKNSKLVETLISNFDDESVAISYARQFPKDNCRYIERFIRKFNYPEYNIRKTKKDIDTMGVKAFFNSDVCAMYDKEKYEIYGGFPAKIIFGEDAVAAYKALENDFCVVYSSKSKVLHSHNYSIVQNFQRNFDIGVSQKQLDYIYSKVSSENEGIKLVKDTVKHLITKKKFFAIPGFIIQSGAKFIGYRLGKMYTLLPDKIVVACSMNKGYWKRGNKNA